MDKKHTFLKVVVILGTIALCVATYFFVVKYYKEQKSNEKLQLEQAKELEMTKQLYTLETYPKVDASLATQPLTNALIKDFTKQDVNVDELGYSNTHPAYLKLINDEVDLIVVTEPSQEELDLAAEKGVELEVIPVVKEGFVFYVNSNNKVDNLTIEQIQKIYTGEITNWKEVGGSDENIIPYQRPVNSGSQTGMLSLVMKGLNLMTAPKEHLVETMSEIINLVSNYNNGKNAIGYSYYYYATTMFKAIDETVASNIKMLGIDGVKPNNQSIKDSTYPFTTAYYIVLNKKDGPDSPARILANQFLSERGQKVAEEAGYVPVN